MDAINNKDKLHKTIMVGGGVLLGLMTLSWGVRFLSNASQQVKTSEQKIQVIAPQEKTEPLMVGQSLHNQVIQKTQTELDLSISYFKDSINKVQADLVNTVALKWLIEAKKEAPKEELTEKEFLSLEFLETLNKLQRVSENGRLNPTPKLRDEYSALSTEIQGILLAISGKVEPGSPDRVITTSVLMAGNDVYMKLLNQSNIQMQESEKFYESLNKRRLADTAPDQVSPKAIEEEPIEEEVNQDGNQ